MLKCYMCGHFSSAQDSQLITVYPGNDTFDPPEPPTREWVCVSCLRKVVVDKQECEGGTHDRIV